MAATEPQIVTKNMGNAIVVTLLTVQLLEDAEIASLEQSLLQIIKQANVVNIVLNFENVNFLSSAVFLNKGGKFVCKPLPADVQLSMVNTILCADIDNTGIKNRQNPGSMVEIIYRHVVDNYQIVPCFTSPNKNTSYTIGPALYTWQHLYCPHQIRFTP